jgi:hypothetical protein
MTKLSLPPTRITADPSTGFLKYYAISALLGFLVVGFVCWALNIAL